VEEGYKWSSLGFNLGPVAFSYLYERPTHDDSDSKVVLFADNTSIIITIPNQEGLKITLNKTLSDIILWFKANFLLLKFNKMCYLLF